jgi:hypothetical protein
VKAAEVGRGRGHCRARIWKREGVDSDSTIVSVLVVFERTLFEHYDRVAITLLLDPRSAALCKGFRRGVVRCDAMRDGRRTMAQVPQDAGDNTQDAGDMDSSLMSHVTEYLRIDSHG